MHFINAQPRAVPNSELSEEELYQLEAGTGWLDLLPGLGTAPASPARMTAGAMQHMLRQS